MATGRSTGRPRSIKAASTAFKDISAEDLDKIPPFPEGLREDGEIMWVKIWAGAHEWLHKTDEFVITELCQVYQDKELYRRALELGAVQRVYRLSNKTLVPHPYVAMLKDARAQMNAHFASLGFNPEARARIGAVEALQDDPVLELMRGKVKRTESRRAKQEAEANDE